MDELNDFQKERIEFLQEKVNEYQQDPDLCASLTEIQCTILAELQTIYNILTNKTLSNIPSIYSNTCKGVKDEMKQFNIIYINMESEQLYENYIIKYQEAKIETRLTKLSDIN